MLGAAAHARIHVLTGGRWGDALAPAVRALQQPLPWWLLLFLPLLAGLSQLYPWAADPAGWAATMSEPAAVRHWFEPAFFGLRLLVYAAGFAWLARAGRWRTPGRAALALMIYMLLGSLAAADLLMSLVAGWSSSVFGWLALTGQLTAGLAAASLLALRTEPLGAAEPGQAPVSRDLGNLLLMCVMLQAYLQFMQLLIIWAENLPREISWYVPRFQTGWSQVGVALIVLQFALPFLALLWRRVKDDPRRLAGVAAGVLAVQALGAAWLVVPSVQAHGFAAWWLLPLTLAGMPLLLFGHLAPSRAPGRAAWILEPADERP